YFHVTGVQTCALPISPATVTPKAAMLGLVSDRRGITHHAPLVDRNPDQPAGPAQYPDRDRPDDAACGAQGSDSPPGFPPLEFTLGHVDCRNLGRDQQGHLPPDAADGLGHPLRYS